MVHFDLGDALTNVLFSSPSCEMGLVIFMNCTVVLQKNINWKNTAFQSGRSDSTATCAVLMANHQLKGQQFTVSGTAACAALCHFNEAFLMASIYCPSFCFKIPGFLLEYQKEERERQEKKKG